MIFGDSSLLENMLWDQGAPNTFDLLVNWQVGDVEISAAQQRDGNPRSEPADARVLRFLQSPARPWEE
jgi:hypothetical protein